jgi:hypothetical protein
MTLLQIGAFGGSFASGIGRDRVELGREPGDEIGELTLASPNLLQLFDEARALSVSPRSPRKARARRRGRSIDTVRTKAAISANPSCVETRRGARRRTKSAISGSARQSPRLSNGGPFQYAAAVSFGTSRCWQGQSGSSARGGAELAFTTAAKPRPSAVTQAHLRHTGHSAARRAIRPFAGS